MKKQSLQEFVSLYESEDIKWIEIAWNGKYGNKYRDQNYFFRLQITEIVVSQIKEVNLTLIYDLFIELGKSAQLSLRLYPHYHMLAQELLQRGGKKYLFEYVCAAHISFDTFLSTAQIKLSSSRKGELLAHFDSLKKSTTQEGVKKLFIPNIRERFIQF